MMSDNPLMAIKFGEDPKGRYRAMKIAMEALAGSLCCELFDNGLAGQGIHLSCEEYAIIHPDEERPVKERPIHPAPTATKVVYSMYKEAKDKAKMAKKLALMAYLEAKRIKNEYMIDDINDSENDEEDETV
jgi:hypothetical protein